MLAFVDGLTARLLPGLPDESETDVVPSLSASKDDLDVFLILLPPPSDNLVKVLLNDFLMLNPDPFWMVTPPPGPDEEDELGFKADPVDPSAVIQSCSNRSRSSTPPAEPESSSTFPGTLIALVLDDPRIG